MDLLKPLEPVAVMWGEAAAEQTARPADCEEHLGGLKLFISIHVREKTKKKKTLFHRYYIPSKSVFCLMVSRNLLCRKTSWICFCIKLNKATTKNGHH